MRKALLLLLFAIPALSNRGEFLNSVGQDGRFHLNPKMYLCLNISFDPGKDIRNEASLKGQLIFDGAEGNSDVDKAPNCVPVTQKMIDRTNEILDLVIKQYGPVYKQPK